MKDYREICQYCKSEDTQSIHGPELSIFIDYYKGEPFKAMQCACGGRWHYLLDTKGAHKKLH